MATAFILAKITESYKGTGLTTYSKATASNNGLMAHTSKGTTNQVWKMGKEHMCGLINQVTKGNGKAIKSTGTANTTGLMGDHTLATI